MLRSLLDLGVGFGEPCCVRWGAFSGPRDFCLMRDLRDPEVKASVSCLGLQEGEMSPLL